jgi:hypothetical protein
MNSVADPVRFSGIRKVFFGISDQKRIFLQLGEYFLGKKFYNYLKSGQFFLNPSLLFMFFELGSEIHDSGWVTIRGSWIIRESQHWL